MTINCKGNLIDLSVPKVMGILNVTPDSFFDGGRFDSDGALLAQTEKMLSEGAHFIDVGGYSSKPGAALVTEADEINRVVPAIRSILKHFPDALISVDTFRSRVAEAAVASGAAIVNDISAGNLDPDMMPTVANLRVPYIMMHMKGDPKTMQGLALYDNISREVVFYFSEKVAEARRHGISDLIIDPGFGFAKTLPQNYELLRESDRLQFLNLPILVGISRKSMIYKALNISNTDALNGTTVLNTMALTKGANILRVHDVKEAVEAIALFNLASPKN
ncbi:dihydropteroate synthase [Flavobacterium magnum]|uniref:Dihydropteroate synthase n=1 Tax=Flavobacterium magnum TaxID=2162713 RepID=A0A2S0RGD8_9FLAO|nr:dihydropteroate synthase [Flavobacterium magnum]AWA30360.1 dihydropteroate synthase [Flavobacterium magnum]